MSTIKFNCPNCSQHFEASGDVAGTEVNCPSCAVVFRAPKGRSGLKAALTWAVILAVAFGVYWNFETVYLASMASMDEEAADSRPLSDFEISEKQRSTAESSLLKECSNYLGFSRILDHYIYADGTATDPTNWQANATIDYVNKVGGFERTNLIFKPFKYGNSVYMVIDSGAMWHRQIADEKAIRDLESKWSVSPSYSYDEAAELHEAARRLDVALASVSVSKAAPKPEKPPILRVVRTISGGAEVEAVLGEKHVKVYIHNIPPDVLSFVDDYNSTLEGFEETRYANVSETVTINGPFRRAGELTAAAQSVLATRRHLAELDACLVAKTSVLARPTRAVSPGGFQRWEFVGIPSPEEALRATHENQPRHFVQN